MAEIDTEVIQQEDIPVFHKKKNKKLPKIIKRVILFVLIAAVLGGIGYGIWNVFRKKPVQTETAFAQIGTLNNVVSGSGTATPEKSADIVGFAKGEVEQINVAVGDKVNEGDLLMVVNDAQLQDKRSQAQDTYNDALKAVNDNYKKIEALNVKAPISGKLIGFETVEGNELNEGSTVGTVVDESALKLSLYYSTRYIDMVYVGQSADVFIPQTMTNVKGTVSDVIKMNKVSDEGAVLFQVIIKVPNPGALASGMTASASISAKETIMPYDSGKLEYWLSKVVMPEASGTVTKVYVDNYTAVKAGQVLFKMENNEYSETAKTLNKTLEVANTTLQEVNDELKYYQITSPITGTVLAINVNVGDNLDGGSNVLISVANIDKMTIEAQIDELDVAKLQAGMAATINIYNEKGQETFMGTLTSIGLQGKIQNGFTYYPGIIEFEGSQSLRSGMWVDFSIQTSNATDMLIVPQKAVKNTEMGAVCFVKDNGEEFENKVELEGIEIPKGFVAVSVVTGESDAVNIQIVEGLQEGTEVALGEMQTEENGGVIGVY